MRNKASYFCANALNAFWPLLLAFFSASLALSNAIFSRIFFSPGIFSEVSALSSLAILISLAPVTYIYTVIQLRKKPDCASRKRLNSLAWARLICWSILYFYFLPESLELIGAVSIVYGSRLLDLFFKGFFLGGIIFDLVIITDWYLHADYICDLDEDDISTYRELTTHTS